MVYDMFLKMRAFGLGAIYVTLFVACSCVLPGMSHTEKSSLLPDDTSLAKLTRPVMTPAQLSSLPEGPCIVVMRGDAVAIAEYVRFLKGRVITQTRSVVSAMIDSRHVSTLLHETTVSELAFGHPLRFMESSLLDKPSLLPKLKYSPLPLSLRSTGVPSAGLKAVQAGKPPLAHAHTGKGVILAVIESTLPDFRHPDFRNSDGTTRFHSLWDMNRLGKGPEGYEYGKHYSPSEINELLKNQSDRLFFGDNSAHSTHSMSVAAGNGNGHPQCMGVAPEATLMYVAVGHQMENIIDAVSYVFSEADKLKMPSVVSISLSLGHLQGYVEDGNDMVSLALSELVEAQPARFIFCSAGNQDSIKQHILLQPDGSNEQQCCLQLREARNHFSLLISQDSADKIEYQTCLMSVSKEHVQQKAISPWFNAASLLKQRSVPDKHCLQHPREPSRLTISQTPLRRADQSISVKLRVDRIGKPAGSELSVLSLRCRGKGTLEAWFPLGLSPVIRTAWPGQKLPAGLVEADNFRSISSPANGRSVIAVGACSSDGVKQEYSQSGGQYGNQWKPLVLAPVPAPASMPLDTTTNRTDLLHDGLYEEYGGTSCAAPVMAGVGALYLQKHPRASLREFNSAIKETVIRPVTAGSLPNPHYGYGVANIFGLMTK